MYFLHLHVLLMVTIKILVGKALEKNLLNMVEMEFLQHGKQLIMSHALLMREKKGYSLVI